MFVGEYMNCNYVTEDETRTHIIKRGEKLEKKTAILDSLP